MSALALGCPLPPVTPVTPNVEIELATPELTGDFKAPVAADPWTIEYDVVVENNSNRPVTINHLASRVAYQPNAPAPLRSWLDVQPTSFVAPVGSSTHTLRKARMTPVPGQAQCSRAAAIDLALFSIEGSNMILRASSGQTQANCTY